MRTLAGPESHVQFTHLSKSSCDFLRSQFDAQEDNLARVSFHQSGVIGLLAESGIPLNKVCLLDPKAERELSPEDGDGRFEWFLFGVRPRSISITRFLFTRRKQGILGTAFRSEHPVPDD